MADKTSNHKLNLYGQGDDDWTHTPDMETIEESLIVRDLEENRDEYTPYVDALLFAKDSKTWYIGDSTSWNQLGTVDDSTAEGIANTRDHVGPMYQGMHHQTSNGAGVMFWAQAGLSIYSCVIDADLSAVNHNKFPVALVSYDNGADHSTDPNYIGTTQVSVSGGPERVDLSGLPEIPSDGEYVLAHDVNALTDGEDPISLRRIKGVNFGSAAYDEQTYEAIDFRQGTAIYDAGDFGSEDYYYYFFDIEVGDTTNRVMSPWSHDVEEIYMRPHDPKEEFDDVSPRAIWFDTS